MNFFLIPRERKPRNPTKVLKHRISINNIDKDYLLLWDDGSVHWVNNKLIINRQLVETYEEQFYEELMKKADNPK